MSVFINFNICDNADECSGLDICPTEAIYWDDTNNTLKTDNAKCISCDACIGVCPAGAILVAHNVEEEKQIKNDIANDPRTLEALMVERYGASPIDDATLISIQTAKAKLYETTSLLGLEIIDDQDTPCLINSVPISEVFINSQYEYYKITIHDPDYISFAEDYKIIECPTLLVFKDNVLLIRMDGPVENGDLLQRTEFISKIGSII